METSSLIGVPLNFNSLINKIDCYFLQVLILKRLFNGHQPIKPVKKGTTPIIETIKPLSTKQPSAIKFSQIQQIIVSRFKAT